MVICVCLINWSAKSLGYTHEGYTYKELLFRTELFLLSAQLTPET